MREQRVRQLVNSIHEPIFESALIADILSTLKRIRPLRYI